MKIKTLLVVLIPLLLTGCPQDPETSTQVNANFNVDQLFTHKGCTVFRFYDGGRSHYYTNCDRGTSETTDSWSQSCGKNCVTTQDEEVTTNYKE